jgi:hypothetical protein
VVDRFVFSPKAAHFPSFRKKGCGPSALTSPVLFTIIYAMNVIFSAVFAGKSPNGLQRVSDYRPA